jgi:hypothetical protein
MGWSILDADFTPNLVRIARRFTFPNSGRGVYSVVGEGEYLYGPAPIANNILFRMTEKDCDPYIRPCIEIYDISGPDGLRARTAPYLYVGYLSLSICQVSSSWS